MTIVEKYLVIHGPNLNLLGTREPEVYGTVSLQEINEKLRLSADKYGVKLVILQSNSEGEIIDILHQHRDAKGIIINPAAYSHYSIAIHDAIKAINVPTVEVHLSNIYGREEFRRHSVVSPACIGQISGFGYLSYLLALEALMSSDK
ncbi:3-dehydroquinate dehydratase-2 [Alkaliphilus hydrothermalis]|uniref:3-dehydroquinate dehydratase n=1 Tax=Alkaliphilus hydrothermalis TaxID=1482730 RepID=A0ABS2NM42_9FIRM|nr:type II 3-dehydroquinate dehydratase [Alkaliphilus hydrothermalis]MBM7613991.1 3-dehydroquinate dehydratase-2 [Alkaliphilus hydrothermalis]